MAPIEYLDPDHSFKHWIASDLRFFREREGMSLTQMGKVMGCNRHNVSNLEHARDSWNMNERQAAALDVFLRLNGHFARLVRFARTRHDPEWFVEYAKHEAKALEIRTYRLSLFPGLFQTPECARELLTSSRLVTDVDAAVDARVKRQEVLTRPNPPLVWVLLDETVLLRPVGGERIMRDQLARLLEAIELPNVTVRIVPLSAGFHLGLDGMFNYLTMPTGELAFAEAPGGGRLIQGLEVREFSFRWDRIGASALPWDVSRDLITKAMEQFS